MRHLIGLLVLGIAAPAGAQIVTDMTPELIQEAIAAGESGRSSGVGLWNKGRTQLCGFFTTPFTRVSSHAEQAKQDYRKLRPEEITADMLDPHLLVHGTASPTDRFSEIRIVKLIVIAPGGNDDVAAVLRPTSVTLEEKSFRNNFGVTATGVSMNAKFPLSALTPGSEVRVVYDSGGECRSVMDLEGVR